MPDIDDILKLIGLTTVIIIVSVIVFGVMIYAYGFLVGVTHGMAGADDQDGAVQAQKDYNYKLDLVKEQTQRIDMYYAAKTSTEMSQIEFKSWLQTIRGLTDEFITRENNATDTGRAYLIYLQPNSDEYSRVKQNEATSKDDIKKVTDTYDGNVYIYNQQYGAQYGNIPYLQ